MVNASTRTGHHHIVVSSENNSYMAWQCKLFHYSCVSRLGLVPVFIVHSLERKWHPYFSDIVEAGGIVRSAPSYRTTRRGHDYSPRNTPGTLLEAAQIGYDRGDYIVLCDADMIFLSRIKFNYTFAAEGCTNLDYDQAGPRRAAQRLGIDGATLRRSRGKIECAVPHVIPVTHARSFADAWLEAIDSFDPGIWETSMYAFGLATLRLGLRLKLTYDVALNDEQHFENAGTAKIIHYAYGDDTWNKRHYWEARAAKKVWYPTVKAREGTVLSEIVKQIREARDFYSRTI